MSGDERYAFSRSTKTAGSPQHAAEDPDTMVWDLEARCVIWQGDLGAFAATAVALDLAAGRIVFCDGRSLMVWPMDEQLQRPFTLDSLYSMSTGEDCSVALSADGRIAASYGDYVLRVWSLEQRRCVGNVIRFLDGRLSGVCMSADGRYVATMHVQPDGLQLLELSNKSAQGSIAHIPGKHAWASFAVSADQRHVAATGAGARAGLQLWEVRGKDDVQRMATLHGHAGPVRAVVVGADRRAVTVCGDSGGVTELQVWDSTPWWQRLVPWLGGVA